MPMWFVRKVAVLAIMAAASVSGARAADLVTYPTSTGQQLPVTNAVPGYDWNGFYSGIYGVYQHSPNGGGQYGLGIDAGVDATFNYFLAGGEVAVQGLGLGDGAAPTSYGQVLARAGVLVTDNTLLYGAAGYGIDLGTPAETDALVGGGLEYAVTDNVLLRAQYLHGFPLTGNNPKDQVSLGAQFHF
jgi:outer membrane immunogenic protein